MASQRWLRVKQIFADVLAQDPDARAAFLAEACADDPAMHQEIESLLLADEQAGGEFMQPPGLPTTAAASEPGRFDRRRIGAYELVQEIGHGGMGAVYLAVRVDDQFRKRVAIKLIKRGVDTDSVLRRFRNERQILASLDHPNIARLLDGGTSNDGLPYFLMEYIEGKPVDAYCDAHRLSTIERLKLFRSVCAAVHYAHQNLVVHRDIKPGNILVTAEGVPKLVDFGIAKLLNPEISGEPIAPTVAAFGPMTVEYASPEQVRGDPITIGSDIYSLGVVLYELLTGHRPYRLTSRLPHEVARVISEDEPERPSSVIRRVEEAPSRAGFGPVTLTPELVSKTRDGEPRKLRRKLVGDMDTIVLMALRKEPWRRYGSVQQFSDDIQRYLEGRPVIARKDTVGYRSGKFILRHKTGVLAGCLLLVTLVGGIATTAWQARRAERRFNDVRKLANSILFEFHDAIRDLPGSTSARELLVKRALEYLDGLAREAGGDRALQSELAAAYERVGDVQGGARTANLGNTVGAMASYRKALALREALAAADPTSTLVRVDLAAAYDKLADTQNTTGDQTSALQTYRRALALRQTLLAADPVNMKLKRDMGSTHHRIGIVLFNLGDRKGSVESYRQAFFIFQSLWSADRTNLKAGRDYAYLCKYYGSSLQDAGERTAAMECFRTAVALDEARLRAEPQSSEARMDLSFSYGSVGAALGQWGDTTGALENYRKALPLREAVANADPKNAWARGGVAYAHSRLGWLLTKIGDRAGALGHYSKALAIREELAAADPTNVEALLSVPTVYEYIGETLAKFGDASGAIRAYQKALASCDAVPAGSRNSLQVRRQIASGNAGIGWAFASSGDRERARNPYEEAISLYRQILAAEPSNHEIRLELAQSCRALAEIHEKLAADGRAPLETRRRHWRQARSGYEQCLQEWIEVRNRSALKPEDAGMPDKVAGAIGRCDAALVKLGEK